MKLNEADRSNRTEWSYPTLMRLTGANRLNITDINIKASIQYANETLI